jgi:hypothetical protein
VYVYICVRACLRVWVCIPVCVHVECILGLPILWEHGISL